MTREQFVRICHTCKPVTDEFQQRAWQLHADVNQTYGHKLPYGFHLMLTASYVTRYGHLAASDDADVLTLYGGAYFHDTIEDARVTYHDLLGILEETRARHPAAPLDIHAIAEVVYALTNNRGRNREERADASYYQLIRQTPFAPFVKCCDRLANYRYSSLFGVRTRMCDVYEKEMKHFVAAITQDDRNAIPQPLLDEMDHLIDQAKGLISFDDTSLPENKDFK
jgi:(p)ppGpp synthase/HD superfamily hydrolase